MSKKRTSPDFSNDEQTNEGSDSVFQQGNNAKRARLAPLHDTTLQDLPIELLECILVKAVVMEVKDLKLAKSVWKEKADPVISRLRTVSSQWNNILTTDFFTRELHRTLDALEMMVHMEILHQYPIGLPAETYAILGLISTKDQVFMICQSEGQDYFTCNVYDLNNMAEVKAVIPLPGKYPPHIAACSVSNCVYALCRESYSHEVISILRITKDDEHQFTVSPLISDMWMPLPACFATANGSLILAMQESSKQLTVISTYDANGSLQHEIRFSPDILRLYMYDIIPRSNGNIVLVSVNGRWQAKLTEVDMDGTILRQYQSSIEYFCCVCDADNYGRILIADGLRRTELLDSEFNLMDFTGPQLDEDKLRESGRLHYNGERNEVVTTVGQHLTLMTLRTVF